MATKENKLIQLFYPNVQWKLGQEDCLDRAERCVVIADDFAIDFAEWIFNDWLADERWSKISDEKELLQIYKKEKGL
jgi:hypothetical protein